jgi:Phage integrase family
MAEEIGQSGIPSRCITHGLRKAAARRLAEAGCSANEIAAITGHGTPAEISRYTMAAEQETLARSGISRLVHSPPATKSQTHLRSWGNPEKPNEINADCSTGAP